MGKDVPLKAYYVQAVPVSRPLLTPNIKRTRPRSYIEWKTLRRWGKLPPWEDLFPGYLLREARERAGFSQRELASRLGCSQQAIAQAERPCSNPTVQFLRDWAREVGAELTLSIDRPD
jgi:DNA-binding XRE family transcriptional regulator